MGYKHVWVPTAFDIVLNNRFTTSATESIKFTSYTFIFCLLNRTPALCNFVSSIKRLFILISVE